MKRSYILSAASAIALATGLANAPAMAFDYVDWDWYLDVDTDVYLDVYERIDVDPKGLTIVEIEQDFKGENIAVATVKDVDIDPKGHWAPDDLGAISNVAAALGNSASVTTETSAQVNVKQDVDGGYYYGSYFSASASVKDISDATVSNAAQAIANNFSLTVDPSCGDSCGHVGVDDMLAIVNVEQSSHSDSYAYASVKDVEISDFYDLGPADNDLNRNLISNTAIAAGNVVSITVVRGAIPFPDQDN
jgi:hypothetical protein